MKKISAAYAICLPLVLPIVLTSCFASADKARIRYILEKPALTVDMRNAIANGELARGMRFEDVRASWGKPDAEMPGAGASGEEVTRWIYVKKLGSFVSVQEVSFVDGVISEMESYERKKSFRADASKNYDPVVVK